jgi:uncharacterized protein YbjT (DUF2867 family)
MQVLVIGASGFIGSRIVNELMRRNHSLLCAGRRPSALMQRFPRSRVMRADLTSDTANDWLPRLQGVDAVVNAAGAMHADLEGLQHHGPCELFQACACAGIAHLTQISAIGAGEVPDWPFLATKSMADRCLLELADAHALRGWCVVRPSLVIGRGGASTELFASLAAAPWPIRLAEGRWCTQPLHVADLASIIADLTEQERPPPVLDVVGPDVMTTDELTVTVRAWLGLPPRRFVGLPRLFILLGARLAGPLDRRAVAALARGNTANLSPLISAMGRPPRQLSDALASEPAVRADRWVASLLPLRGLLRLGLVAIWLGSAAASFALPGNAAANLLRGMTADRATAIGLTWSGAAVDGALGLALLVRPWRRAALLAQLALVLAYSLLATILLPELWLDPFGSLLKNIAVAGTALTLLAVED